MRPLVKSDYPKQADGVTNKVYSPYDIAKDDLFNNIGEYCSFCESYSMSSSLAVEHVQAKKYVDENGVEIYAHLEEDWGNFLIGCVHCNSIKGSKNVILNNFHLPHRNNTYLSFRYSAGGLITINPNLPVDEQNKANNLIDLVGLDRLPNTPNYSRKDNRWKGRRRAWELANRYLVKYNSNNVDAETITDLVLERGYWSIWMTVFKDVIPVEDALIQAFNGSFANCRIADINRTLP